MSGEDLQGVVFVADDDPDDRFIAADAIRRIAPEVEIRFAEDGEKLLHALLDESDALPDVVLLDINMPRMDGWEALEQIRDSRRTKALPVVILTTSSMEEDRARAHALGADGYEVKPN